MAYKFSYGTSFFSGSLDLGGSPTSLSASHEIQAGSLAVSGAVVLGACLRNGLVGDGFKTGVSLSASHEIQAGTIISSGSGHFGLTLSGNDLIAAGALQIGAAGGASDPRAGGNFATIAGPVSVGSQLTGSDVIVCGRLMGNTAVTTGSITAGTTLIAGTHVSGADGIQGGRATIGKSITIGGGIATDTSIVFDGNAQDFYIGLDDSADMFVIGSGSNASEQQMMRFTTGSDLKIYVGDARPADTMVVFDGAAADYRIGIDDGTDKLEIGAGSTMGTTAAIVIDGSGDLTQLGTDTPSTNEVLTWDGSKWVAAAASGGGTSSTGSNMGQPIPLSPALPLSGGLNYGAGTLGSSITVTLPASGAAGDTVIVKGHSNLSPSNTVTIDGAGSDTIDGEAAVVLQSAFASVTCVCIDGANWIIV